jgi:hypothetical protein
MDYSEGLSPAGEARTELCVALDSLRSFVNVAVNEVKQKNFYGDDFRETLGSLNVGP